MAIISFLLKVIGVEQAKTLSASEHFSSMTATIQTFRNCARGKESEEFVTKNCPMRPPSSAKDVVGFRYFNSHDHT